MTKKDEKAKATPEPRRVVVTPGERVRIRVLFDGEREAEYVAEVAVDGTPRIYPAPEPAAPVQDPDPVSGT